MLITELQSVLNKIDERKEQPLEYEKFGNGLVRFLRGKFKGMPVRFVRSDRLEDTKDLVMIGIHLPYEVTRKERKHMTYEQRKAFFQNHEKKLNDKVMGVVPEIKKYSVVRGWFLLKEPSILDINMSDAYFGKDDEEFDETASFRMEFQPNLGLRIKDSELPSIFYHVTERSALGKIFKKGLLPQQGKGSRTQQALGTKFNYPDRVFMFKTREGLKNAKLVLQFKDPVVLKISRSQLRRGTKFYRDSAWDTDFKNAVYTFTHIPAKAISGDL